MFSIQPILNSKGLLAAMITAALSGQVVADVAGRVNFVAGDVLAIGSDGSQRTLSRGDLVNSGERLETGRGRVQIRFTDGSFISLQPNSVFGLDNYSYAKDKPNEGSLLFNFIRGGMRTVSGAIGKVNRANYAVRTPVATIGIRGTSYTSTLNNGKLLVSVSKGIVNLQNDFGVSNINAGQTFQAEAGQAPSPAPAGITAQARAEEPDGERTQVASTRSEDRNLDTLDLLGTGALETTVVSAVNDAAAGRLDTPTQQPTSDRTVFTNSTVTINGSNVSISPRYSVALALVDEAASTSDFGIQFSNTTTNDRNGITRIDMVVDDGEGSLSKQAFLDLGTLKMVNIQNRRNITLGEWTDGAGSLDGESFAIPAGLFAPYIAGLQSNNHGTSGTVAFTLDAASAARNSSASGTLERFNFNVDYSRNTVDVDLRVQLGQASYTLNQTGIQVAAVNTASFNLENLLAQGPDCAQGGCLTDLGFFFTGSGNTTQVGSSYNIDLLNGGTIFGVAALQRAPIIPDSRPLFPNSVITINTAQTDGTIEPFYAFASSQRLTRTGTLANAQVGVQFKNSADNERNAITRIDELTLSQGEGRPLVTQSSIFDVGTLQTANIQTKDGITFGEWTNGTGTFDNTALTIAQGQFVPYIVGLQANSNNENSKITFTLAGATAARNGTQAGTLDRYNLTVNYAQGLVDIDMQVSFLGSQYVVTQQGIHRFAIDNVAGSDLEGLLAQGANCATNGCPTTIGFFFAGVSANNGDTPATQVGSSYQINLLDNSSITGVAALQLNSAATQLFTPTNIEQLDTNHDSVFSGTFVSAQANIGLTTHHVDNELISGKFDPTTGELLLANTTDSSYGRIDNSSSAHTINVGSHKKVLAWGQWTGGDVNHNAVDSTTLLNNADLHYIVGIPTTSANMLASTGSVSYTLNGGSIPQATLDGTQGYISQTGSLDVNFTGNQGLGSANLQLTLSGFANNAVGLTSLQMTSGETAFSKAQSTLTFDSLAVSAFASGTPLTTSATASAAGSFVGGLIAPTGSTGSVPTAAGLGYTVNGTLSDANQNQTTLQAVGTAAFTAPRANGG